MRHNNQEKSNPLGGVRTDIENQMPSKSAAIGAHVSHFSVQPMPTSITAGLELKEVSSRPLDNEMKSEVQKNLINDFNNVMDAKQHERLTPF